MLIHDPGGSMSKKKISAAAQARIKLQKQFDRRLNNLRENTKNAIRIEQAMRREALRQNPVYAEQRRTILKRFTGAKRKARLESLRRRSLSPYDATIARLKARQTTYTEAIKSDKRRALAALKKAQAAQDKAFRAIQAKQKKKLKKKVISPMKMAKRGGYKSSAKSLTARIKEAKDHDKLSLPYRFPITKNGWLAYMDLMKRSAKSPNVQSWQWSIETAGAGRAMSFANRMREPELWLTLDYWLSQKTIIMDIADMKDEDKDEEHDATEQRVFKDSRSGQSIIDVIGAYITKNGKRPRLYIQVLILLGKPF